MDVQGILSGFGKGVVGTVTKPVTGMLDFAAGTASAVRDSSRIGQRQPPRKRKPRCSRGPGGLLPAYNRDHADAQQLLHNLSSDNSIEMLVYLLVFSCLACW